MLGPYLLPPELPETQLVELHEYAMSFVERNGHDLIDSLLDWSRKITSRRATARLARDPRYASSGVQTT